MMLKYSHKLSFDPGLLCVRVSGHGDKDGTGYIQFDEDDVDFHTHDDRDGSYCCIEFQKTELIALRDFLLEMFPLDRAIAATLIDHEIDGDPA